VKAGLGETQNSQPKSSQESTSGGSAYVA